jgi:hypothetical protein
MEGKETAGRRETAGGRETPAETETARRPRPNEMVTSGADSLVVCRLEREGGTVAHDGDRERWEGRRQVRVAHPRSRRRAAGARALRGARAGLGDGGPCVRRRLHGGFLAVAATGGWRWSCVRDQRHSGWLPTLLSGPGATALSGRALDACAPAWPRRTRAAWWRAVRGDPALADGGGRDGGDGGRPEDDARGATGRAVPPGNGRERLTGGNGRERLTGGLE